MPLPSPPTLPPFEIATNLDLLKYQLYSICRKPDTKAPNIPWLRLNVLHFPTNWIYFVCAHNIIDDRLDWTIRCNSDRISRFPSFLLTLMLAWNNVIEQITNLRSRNEITYKKWKDKLCIDLSLSGAWYNAWKWSRSKLLDIFWCFFLLPVPLLLLFERSVTDKEWYAVWPICIVKPLTDKPIERVLSASLGTYFILRSVV